MAVKQWGDGPFHEQVQQREPHGRLAVISSRSASSVLSCAVIRLQCGAKCLLVRCCGVSFQLSNECSVIRNENHCILQPIVILSCVYVCAVIVELGTVAQFICIQCNAIQDGKSARKQCCQISVNTRHMHGIENLKKKYLSTNTWD